MVTINIGSIGSGARQISSSLESVQHGIQRSGVGFWAFYQFGFSTGSFFGNEYKESPIGEWAGPIEKTLFYGAGDNEFAVQKVLQSGTTFYLFGDLRTSYYASGPMITWTIPSSGVVATSGAVQWIIQTSGHDRDAYQTAMLSSDSNFWVAKGNILKTENVHGVDVFTSAIQVFRNPNNLDISGAAFNKVSFTTGSQTTDSTRQFYSLAELPGGSALLVYGRPNTNSTSSFVSVGSAVHYRVIDSGLGLGTEQLFDAEGFEFGNVLTQLNKGMINCIHDTNYNAHVAWLGSGSPHNIYYKNFTGGATLGVRRTIATASGLSQPAITIDNTDQTAYIVYASHYAGHVYIVSGGSPWSSFGIIGSVSQTFSNLSITVGTFFPSITEPSQSSGTISFLGMGSPVATGSFPLFVYYDFMITGAALTTDFHPMHLISYNF